MRERVRAYGKTIEIKPYRIKWLARLVYSQNFEAFIAFIIFANAISLAILTMPNLQGTIRESCIALDQFAYVIYVVELLLRLLSYGTKPWMFFRQGWNVFDFMVIGLSPILSNHTALLRVLRILRLIRLFRFLPEVRLLTLSIVKSLPPLISMAFLIFIALFMYGMMGVYLFGEKIPDEWGSITTALTSLFILLTTENFPAYLLPAIAVSPIALPYFLSYIFVVVFTVLNVLIGIVLHAMDQAREEGRKEADTLKDINDIVHQVDDISKDGEVTTDELRELRKRIVALDHKMKAIARNSSPKKQAKPGKTRASKKIAKT